LTVGEWLDEWLESIKDRTWVWHEQVIRLHLKPDIGKVRLSRLNALQLQNLYRNKLDTGLSPRTVQIIHTNRNKALKQAVR
jgi:integrase